MAVEGQDVDMRIEEDTDREEDDLDRSIAPEPKKMKLDSAQEIEPSPSNVLSSWDADSLSDLEDSLSDLEDPESDIHTDHLSVSAARADYQAFCKKKGLGETGRYYFLDSVLPTHVLGCDDWNCPSLYDMQYKELYDTMKENHLHEVVQEKEQIFCWNVGSSASVKIAKEIAMQHQYGDLGPLSEEEILSCLTEIIMEHRWSEELRIFKEYELSLLKSGYWKVWQCYRKGDSTEVQCYEQYDHSTRFDVTHYSLADVQKEFEKWIFKLMPEEEEKVQIALKHIERDHRNRERMLRLISRAKYITMKLEKAEEWGLISMDKLKEDFENNKGHQPLVRQPLVLCEGDAVTEDC